MDNEHEEELSELESKIIYKPCKACGSEKYDNADCKDPVFTKNDLILWAPTKCDQCDFALVIPDSDWHH